MKSKRRKRIKRYKIIKLHEYAIIFNDSEQLIEFVCHIKSKNITNSSLYIRGNHYILLLSSNFPQNMSSHVCFKDQLHIGEIKLNASAICKRDAVNKMQKAFIKT